MYFILFSSDSDAALTLLNPRNAMLIYRMEIPCKVS